MALKFASHQHGIYNVIKRWQSSPCAYTIFQDFNLSKGVERSPPPGMYTLLVTPTWVVVINVDPNLWASMQMAIDSVVGKALLTCTEPPPKLCRLHHLLPLLHLIPLGKESPDRSRRLARLAA